MQYAEIKWNIRNALLYLGVRVVGWVLLTFGEEMDRWEMVKVVLHPTFPPMKWVK